MAAESTNQSLPLAVAIVLFCVYRALLRVVRLNRSPSTGQSLELGEWQMITSLFSKWKTNPWLTADWWLMVNPNLISQKNWKTISSGSLSFSLSLSLWPGHLSFLFFLAHQFSNQLLLLLSFRAFGGGLLAKKRPSLCAIFREVSQSRRLSPAPANSPSERFGSSRETANFNA